MVALTYDVRTVRIPVPRLVLGAGRARLERAVARHESAGARRAPLQEKVADRHRDTALALRAGAGY